MASNQKTRVVVFNDTTARILVNPKDLWRYEGSPNVIVNPDFNLVRGIPPHFWKIEDGKLGQLSRPEKLERLRLIAERGVCPSVEASPSLLSRTKHHLVSAAPTVAVLTAIEVAAYFLFWA